MEPTSNNARKSARKPRSEKSSADYLANQISDARLALESTLDDLTLDISRAADVRRWVRRYPWAALGTALVAGFTLAHVVTKSKRRKNAAADDPHPTSADHDFEPAAAKSARSAKSTTTREEPAGGWRTTVLNALFEILRMAVTQFISASVRQAANPPRHTSTHDGANTPPPSSAEAGPDATEARADQAG